MLNNNDILLSIVTPTYNRAKYLKNLLDSLEAFCKESKFKDNIELIIQDNASQDTTEQLVREYQNLSSYKIIYNKNPQNIGGPLNLLEAIKNANGLYYMYFGDDDIISAKNLDKALSIISENNNPAFIFPSFALAPVDNFVGVKAFSMNECIKKYFFYTGIPGGSAINTSIAKNILNNLNNNVFQTTNWPQTLLAYLVVNEFSQQNSLTKKPVCVSPFAVSTESSHENLTIYTSSIYWETWFGGLLKAAEKLENITNQQLFVNCCQNIFSKIRLDFVLNLIKLHLTFIDTPEEKKKFKFLIENELLKLPDEFQKKFKSLFRYLKYSHYITVLIYSREQYKISLKLLYSTKARNKLKARMIEVKKIIDNHNNKLNQYNAKDKASFIRNYSLEGY